MQRDQKTTRTPRPSMSGGPSTVSIHPSIHPIIHPFIHPWICIISTQIQSSIACAKEQHTTHHSSRLSQHKQAAEYVYIIIYIYNPSLSNHNPGLQNPIFIGEPSFFAAYNETKDCLQHRNPQRERNTYFYSIYIIHL